VDFRKGAHGLAALAQEVLAENPFSGAVIVWRCKRGDRVKILVSIGTQKGPLIGVQKGPRRIGLCR
jgi:transposase